ncbi:MAG: site-specific DNA-methyltransferase [Eubacterium sp.]|uniref:site-specific DNA-methyltransferase n=1 Tax=Eubacterium sp. TaxID=142586 RepID=UPI00300EDFBB
MDKLKMQTENIADKNYEILSKMFPNALTETITGYDEDGKPIVERAIDADVLRQEISCKVVEGKDERYQFTWPDKKKAMLLANAPINKTLRPCREESVNFENTENIYIEGDNLEVLKLLQETYLEKIKVIYIDPPYNTGNDFVYEDDFTISMFEYLDNSGQYDEVGNRLVQNAESNGRFHTDWLNMLYPRIKLAKNLMTKDGVMFISIDDNEVCNLKKICDEIFGEKNFIAELVWEKKKKGAFLSKHYISMKEYILVYAKHANSFNGLIGEINAEEGTYPCIKTTNARGTRILRKGTPSKYKESNYVIKANTRISSGNMELIYLDDMIIRNGMLQKDVRVDSNWIYGQEAMDSFSKKGLIYITQDNYIRRIVNDERVKMLKDLLPRVGSDGKSLKCFEYDKNLNNGGWGTNEDANDELHSLLGQQYLFDFPKPSRLIGKLIQSVADADCIILDFFSGSATTAQAVLELNAADNGKRKYILVQLPEKTNTDSPTYKAGYATICELGKTRIKKVAEKLDKKHDIGFRMLEVDSSNMKDVYYNPSETQQSLFDTYADNIKEDRTPEDLLFQVMLDLGVLLSSKIEETTIAGKKIFNVADGFLIACFDKDVTEETVKAVAEKKPYYAVFRDNSMANDSVATNFDQIFASISPETVRKVL